MSPKGKDERADTSTGAGGPLRNARCRTGIEALDKVLHGGIPAGNTVLLAGSCGTGKTTLALEFLCFGASVGENGLYLAVTEAPARVLSNILSYEFFDQRAVDEKRLHFQDIHDLYQRLLLDKPELGHDDVLTLTRGILDLVRQAGAKRVVVDSITGIGLKLHAKERIRHFVSRLSRQLSDAGATSLLISELTEEGGQYSSFGVEEAVADGSVVLGNVEQRGYLLRTLQVVKMRGTPHSRARYVLDLTPYGMMMVPMLRGGGQG